MSHIVKCAICGKQFDRDKIQAVDHGSRRYSHYTCEPDKELVPMPDPPPKKEKKVAAEDPDLVELKDYIALKYGEKANWPLITRQIKDFHDNKNYTYSGMLKSLVYFYDVKGNTIEKSNGGIGIIDYQYKDAYNYYLSIFMARQNSQDVEFKPVVKEYTIPIPKARGIKNKLLDWSIDDEE